MSKCKIRVLELAAFVGLLSLAHPLTLLGGNGDYDYDNDIDWDDFAAWASCMVGLEGGPVNPNYDACSVFDFDGDVDVDVVDFGAFQAAVSLGWIGHDLNVYNARRGSRGLVLIAEG